MFKNIGKKIQTVSFTLFIIQVVLGVLFGISTGFYMYVIAGFYFRSDVTGILVGLAAGLIAAALMIFVAWLSQLHFYAYGKIAECSEEECRLLRELIALQSGGQAPAAPAASAPLPSRMAGTSPSASSSSTSFSSRTAGISPSAPASPAEQVCVCGTKLSPNALFCPNCGRPQPTGDQK